MTTITLIDKGNDPMLTGQLIFRETTKPSPHAGHKVMMVCGIISVPDDWEGKGEHQYVVSGNEDANIHTHFDTEIDRTEEAKGMTLNQLITSPIWRV